MIRWLWLPLHLRHQLYLLVCVDSNWPISLPEQILGKPDLLRIFVLCSKAGIWCSPLSYKLGEVQLDQKCIQMLINNGDNDKFVSRLLSSLCFILSHSACAMVYTPTNIYHTNWYAWPDEWFWTPRFEKPHFTQSQKMSLRASLKDQSQCRSPV